jgi:hypothetical protein
LLSFVALRFKGSLRVSCPDSCTFVDGWVVGRGWLDWAGISSGVRCWPMDLTGMFHKKTKKTTKTKQKQTGG